MERKGQARPPTSLPPVALPPCRVNTRHPVLSTGHLPLTPLLLSQTLLLLMTSRATPLPPTTPSDSLSLNLHAPGAPNRSTCSPRRVVPLPRARARASIRDTLATVSTRPAIPALGRPTPSLPAPPKKPARQPRSDKAELDALALALYHIAAGAISPPSPMPPPPFKPASPLKPTAVPLPCPAVAAAPPTPASVSMSPQTTKSTLVESDGDSTGADHHTAAPAPSAVAAELRSILQRTEPAESSALGNPSRLFDCLASALFMNGPEDDTLAGAGCSHPHSVWKELDDVSHSGPQAGQSIVRLPLTRPLSLCTLPATDTLRRRSAR